MHPANVGLLGADRKISAGGQNDAIGRQRNSPLMHHATPRPKTANANEVDEWRESQFIQFYQGH